MLQLSGPGSSTSHYALATLAEAKTYANIRNTTDDATILPVLLDSVHRAIFAELGGRFVIATGVPFDQVYDGRGRDELFLDQSPVISVSLVEEGWLLGNGTWQTARSIASTEYQVDAQAGSIVRTAFNVWPLGKLNLRVTYLAGHTLVPPDLKEAVGTWLGIKYRRALDARQDKTSATSDASAETFTRDDAPPAVLRILERYKRSRQMVW